MNPVLGSTAKSFSFEAREKDYSTLNNKQWKAWPLLSLLPRHRSMDSLQMRSQQPASYSVESDDDDDAGLDLQDESRRAKLRGKACYFKICPFNTRAL